MLHVKEGGIKYHFSSLWYDLTWDWTQVFRAISEHIFPKGIRPKVNVLARLEFELAYYDFAVRCFKHYHEDILLSALGFLYFAELMMMTGSLGGVAANLQSCDIKVSEFKSTRAISFTFELILMGKVWTPFF